MSSFSHRESGRVTQNVLNVICLSIIFSKIVAFYTNIIINNRQNISPTEQIPCLSLKTLHQNSKVLLSNNFGFEHGFLSEYTIKIKQ